jgi:hypothetical protein
MYFAASRCEDGCQWVVLNAGLLGCGDNWFSISGVERQRAVTVAVSHREQRMIRVGVRYVKVACRFWRAD